MLTGIAASLERWDIRMNKSIRKQKHASRRQFSFLLMILPGMAYLLINNYIPLFGIVIAFKKIDFSKGIFKSPWVGFQNFEFLFKTDDAFIMTRNTILYNLAFIVLGTVFSVAVAILLNELRSKMARKLYQTVILLPYLISIIIVSYITYALLNTETGLFNGILTKIGKDAVYWYSEAKYWPVILIFISMWKSVGYSAIVYLATITGIDQSLYEAASVDGAGRLTKIFRITLPLLKPTIITLVLLSVGRIFYSDFGLFYQVPMNSGALYDVTQTIDTYVYRALLQMNNLSMSSAASVFQSLVGFVTIVIVNLLVRKADKDLALF